MKFCTDKIMLMSIHSVYTWVYRSADWVEATKGNYLSLTERHLINIILALNGTIL